MLCRYAWECQTQEGGWGLDSVLREQSWKLRGIVNGIDYSEWSPQARGDWRAFSCYTFDYTWRTLEWLLPGGARELQRMAAYQQCATES